MSVPYHLKIVLLGDNAVGKSSLSARFANDRFNATMDATIGSAYVSNRVKVGEKNIILGIWDTAGSERYDAMTKLYYRGSQAAVICYDVTRPETANRVKYWFNELRSFEESCKIYICATKIDLLSGTNKVESFKKMEEYAKGVQAKFYSTSSKTGENVVELFQDIANDCAEMIEDERDRCKSIEFIRLSNTNNKRTYCC